MKGKWIIVFLAMFAGCTSLLAQQESDDLQVVPDANQVLASSLLGSWQLDDSLNRRLGHLGGEARLQFDADPGVLKKVPAAIAKRLRDHRIYLAGQMLKGEQHHVFLVVVFDGNPRIVWFRERGGDPMADTESWNACIARGEAKAADLLFLGGDHNNQSFAAYAREPKVGKLTPAAAIAEMTRLLVAGEAKAFVSTYCAPEDLGKLVKQGRGVDELAKRFEGERGQRLIEALELISKAEPLMSEDGDLATWRLDKEGMPSSLSLQRIDGRWYLRNR